AVVGVDAERLEAPVVEDGDDDVSALRQRPADLDLTVLSVEAAAELEDPSRACGTAGGEQGTFEHRAVGLLGLCTFRAGAADEEACHLRRALAAVAGYR